MNRRGDERLLSLYWFVMFVIITIAVVSAVVLFYSHSFDIRAAEAGILADKIIACAIHDGYLDAQFMKQDLSLSDSCGIILRDTGHSAYNEREQYGIEFIAGTNNIHAGDARLLNECGIAIAKKNLPVCAERKLSVLGENGGFVLVTIRTAVRKVEQNG